MTPLAFRYVKEITSPKKDRSIDDTLGVIGRMGDVQCFEMSDVFWELFDLHASFVSGQSIPAHLMFMPAQKTWIEWSEGEADGRSAFFLEELDGGRIRSTFCLPDRSDFETVYDGFEDLISDGMQACGPEISMNVSSFIAAALVLINSPRVIGRRQHMPHRGLERELAKRKAMIGKFPLRAWTEIRLDIGPPKDMSGAASVEAHATGDRCLHFCRAHLRFRRGNLEVVRGHWRGDPSLGMKRSRYRLAA